MRSENVSDVTVKIENSNPGAGFISSFALTLELPTGAHGLSLSSAPPLIQLCGEFENLFPQVAVMLLKVANHVCLLLQHFIQIIFIPEKEKHTRRC